MKARVAEDSDYDAVRELLEGLHRHHQRLRPDIFSPVPPLVARDDYRTLLTSSTARVFVAMGRGGAVSGVVVARIQDAGESSVFLRERMVVVRELMVSPVGRGQGLGTALMDAVEEWMRSVGVSRLELNVWMRIQVPSHSIRREGCVPAITGCLSVSRLRETRWNENHGRETIGREGAEWRAGVPSPVRSRGSAPCL